MYWLAVTFAAGIAIGLFVGRDKPVDSVPPSMPATTTAAAPAPVAHVEPAAPRVTATPPPSARIAPAPGPAPQPASPATAEVPADIASFRQPVDPGPVYSKQFAEAARIGARSVMAEQHAALEREARDDSWAYSMEADIQNSLVADTSMGNFKLEHLECRATLCEVRLSATGEQQAQALRKWNDGLHSMPFGSRLMNTNGSIITDNEATDALIILKKPAPAPAPQP